MAHSLVKDTQLQTRSSSIGGGRRLRVRGGVGSSKGSSALNTYESAGPADVKLKGDAAYIAAKYVSLEREARSHGNLVLAENYAQYAEHYRRLDGVLSQAQEQAASAKVGSLVTEDGKVDEKVESAGEHMPYGRSQGKGNKDDVSHPPLPRDHSQSDSGNSCGNQAVVVGVKDSQEEALERTEDISSSVVVADSSASSVAGGRTGTSSGREWRGGYSGNNRWPKGQSWGQRQARGRESKDRNRSADSVVPSVDDLPAFITAGITRDTATVDDDVVVSRAGEKQFSGKSGGSSSKVSDLDLSSPCAEGNGMHAVHSAYNDECSVTSTRNAPSDDDVEEARGAPRRYRRRRSTFAGDIQ